MVPPLLLEKNNSWHERSSLLLLTAHAGSANSVVRVSGVPKTGSTLELKLMGYKISHN